MQHAQQLWNLTRRHFLGRSTAGLGAAALGQLLSADGLAAGADQGSKIVQPLAAKNPPLPAKAKSVIYLHMAGSPPQQELFDYKPKLQEYNDKDCPDEYLKGERFAFIKGHPQLLGPPYKFSRHGESGQEISELLPLLSSLADDLCIVRSMHPVVSFSFLAIRCPVPARVRGDRDFCQASSRVSSAAPKGNRSCL